jgi:hypothetical protein
MKYPKLLPLGLLLSLLCLANINARTRPGHNRAQQRKPQKPNYTKTNKVKLDLCYDFSVPGKTSKIKFIVALPKTMPYRQRIYDITYSPEPSRIFSKNENDYAEFLFVNPKKQLKVEISVKARLFRYDLSIARKKHKENPPKDPNLSNFLKQEAYLEKDAPEVQQIAKTIKGQTQAAVIKNIHNYVINNMEYGGYNPKSLGALKAAQQKKGDCSEYADLFVALCRAKELPARVVSGYTTESTLTPKHAWAEVYFQRYGWVPFDPTWADIKYKSARQFHYLKSVYIYLTHIRSDEVGYYYRYSYWGDKIEVKDSITFK